MADNEQHSKGVKKGLFCAIRTGPKQKCDCEFKNNYVDNCDFGKDWDKYPQKTTKTIKDKITGKIKEKFVTAQFRSFEAHHIACVASVTAYIAGDTEIEDVVKNTKWCINASDNMIGLPMWSHTIMWYCSFDPSRPTQPRFKSAEVGGTSPSYMRATVEIPPFADRPQHDYDHSKYIEEVEDALENVADKVKEKAGKHEEQQKTLVSELNQLINNYKTKLTNRGKRKGGTHDAWQEGMNFRESDWYLPFSMAKKNQATQRIFPLPDMSDGNYLAKKIKEVSEALWLVGEKISLI